MPLFDWIRSDLHSLNLDWIISKIKTVEESEQGAVDAAADAQASKTAAASSATAANNSKTAAAASATAAAGSAAQAQSLVDQLDTTIAQDVSDWLEDNLTPTSPPVDDTLTIQGAAADAKKTGDEISDLKTKITDTNSLHYEPLTYTKTDNRGIAWETGELVSGNNFAYTNFIDISDFDAVNYARMIRSTAFSTVGMAFYNSNQEFISGQVTYRAEPSAGNYYHDDIISVPQDAVYARFTLNKTDTASFYVNGVSKLIKTVADIQTEINGLTVNSESIGGLVGMRNIAYSLIGIAPINTYEHYLSVAKLGFNMIKGDVRVTSDNKLIMCHDAGFTLNASGRITTYSASDSTAIRSMTEAQVLALEHSTYRDALGYYAHPCTFEDFIKACKKTGLPPFITLRDEYMSDIIPQVFATLRKYRLEKDCIINSFTKETLTACRAVSPYVKLSWVQTGDTEFTTALVDETAAVGNCILSLQITDFTGYETILQHAIDKGVEIYNAIIYSYADYLKAISAGITGCQIGRMFMTYKPTLYAFKLNVTGGVITFGDYFNDSRFTADTIDHISDLNSIYIQNIRENGSEVSFPDGVMPTWINTMPYKIGVKETHGYECSVRWVHQTNVNRFIITCSQLATNDCSFEFTVEV